MNPLARMTYFIGQAVRLLRTSPWLATISVLTLAVSLSVVGVLAIGLLGAERLVHQLGERLTISVYITDGTSRERTSEIEARIKSHPGVTSVRLLSREADRERNRKLLDPALLAGLDQEAIPGQAVLELELDSGLASRGDLDALVAWAEKTKGVDAVEDVDFGADKLRLIFAVVEIVRSVGFVVAGILLASALLFVFSTVRFAVYSRREEIEILALMGATPRFIRAPFLIEGATQGLLGSLVAMGLLHALHSELYTLVRDVYRIHLDWSLLPPGMILWLLVAGPLLGLLASGVSVGRYLRV